MGRGGAVAFAGQWLGPQMDRHTGAWLSGLPGKTLLLCGVGSGTPCIDVSACLPQLLKWPLLSACSTGCKAV